MALIHSGTWTTLQAIDIVDISDGDTANIYYNSRPRTFTFDSTSTEAESNTRPGPYYLRPHDYATAGVWEETIGNDYDVISADQIIGSKLLSTNWGASAGSEYDLDVGTIRLGGSASPAFSVSAAGVLSATGATISGTLTATAGTLGGWTLGANSLVSTNIGLHSGASAEILLGHATTYASAKIGFKNDGSGKVADGNISWTAAGLLTQTVTDGGTITLNAGADIILNGDDTDPGLLMFKGTTYETTFGCEYDGKVFNITPKTDKDMTLRFGTYQYAPNYYFWERVEICSTRFILDIDGTTTRGDYVFGTDYVYFAMKGPGSSSSKYMYFGNASDIPYISFPSDTWIGLGSTSGRIEFDNQTTDEINFLNCVVGIGTSTPTGNADLTLEGGILCIKEQTGPTAPTADTNYGKIYTKVDNKLYFQDGAGTEHEISFV